MFTVVGCVCVCVYEREREKRKGERVGEGKSGGGSIGTVIGLVYIVWSCVYFSSKEEQHMDLLHPLYSFNCPKNTSMRCQFSRMLAPS